MNKRTFHYLVEAGWLLLALMPIFVYLVVARTSAGGTNLETFMTVMSQKLDFVTTDNIIYTALNSVFGQEGIFPILHEGMLLYVTYFCIVEVVHLMVDVLVFIPRIAHDWLDAFTRRF